MQDFRETCVSRSLTFCLETKMLWHQTPSRKKKAVVFTTVTTDAYQDQINARFSKVHEIFKVCGIESLKYVREFYTSVCYYRDISTPQSELQLFDMWVKGLMGGPWPIKANTPQAVSLLVREQFLMDQWYSFMARFIFILPTKYIFQFFFFCY